jgi:hypothetical protein
MGSHSLFTGRSLSANALRALKSLALGHFKKVLPDWLRPARQKVQKIRFYFDEAVIFWRR